MAAAAKKYPKDLLRAAHPGSKLDTNLAEFFRAAEDADY